MKLFPPDKLVGIFRGFSEGGLEFHADLVLPYRSEFQSTPMHGQFLLVKLEEESEAVLGRITSLSASGRLASPTGEDYGIRAMSESRDIPEDLRDQYLKYQVGIRVLGVVRVAKDQAGRETVVFAASHRRLPHVGSKVALLADDILKEIAGHNRTGAAELGFLALGEFVYGKGDPRLETELKQPENAWIQPRAPQVLCRFRAQDLVARRSFVFARAGFGKSNLVKLLFANLYSPDATGERHAYVEKREGRKVPVGTIIFDPDGEYFWPDDKNRPGLCDVAALEQELVVFTNRKAPSDFYQSFVAGGIKLDIRRLRPRDVIAIALPAEKQSQQNVNKLRGASEVGWRELVDAVHKDGNFTDDSIFQRHLGLRAEQEAELTAARANLTTIVRMLHDPASQLMDMLLESLRAGKLCVIDLSQLRGGPSLVLSGLILDRIFQNNQDQFTEKSPQTIPTIAVLEEAQSVLGGQGGAGESPYVSWVKEGRKYDLGAVLITQQPGSITREILSQGDNWFIFHLLSAGDLGAVKAANAHFSDDLLSALLNEPIPGHGVYWSSAGGKPYPLPIRALSFESSYKTRDPQYKLPAASTFAQKLRSKADALFPIPTVNQQAQEDGSQDEEPEQLDVIAVLEQRAIAAFNADPHATSRISSEEGLAFAHIYGIIERSLPEKMDGKDQMKRRLFGSILDSMYGESKWVKIQHANKKGSPSWYVKLRSDHAS